MVFVPLPPLLLMLLPDAGTVGRLRLIIECLDSSERSKPGESAFGPNLSHGRSQLVALL
ncbi:hypothetical protein GCM10027288_00530 [Bordetella tumbae]